MGAPTDMVTELLAAVDDDDYDRALRFVQRILKFEPHNTLILDYQRVLQRALKQQGLLLSLIVRDSWTLDDESPSSSSDEDTSSDDESSVETISDLHDDLDDVGLVGTKEVRLVSDHFHTSTGDGRQPPVDRLPRP